MKLKTFEHDGKTYAETQDGKPVYVDDGGKEIAFDAPGTVATITRLNGEAKGHREGKEKAETALKAFEGISDPAAAIKALETVQSLDQKKLIDAGEVDKVRAEAVKAVEEKYAPVLAELDTLKTALHDEKIGGSFSRSKFAAEKLAIPADIAQASFGRHFTIKDGKIVATDAAGNQIFSKTRPGEPADFEEAFEIIVDAYPNKDNILKGDIKGGGGAGQGGGGGNGAKTMARSQFEALPPVERAAKMKEGFTLTEA